MGVIVGEGKNKGVEIFTNDKKSEGNNVVFAFHGTPLIKFFADKIWEIEEGYNTESKVFMPYTEEWTSTMSQARLVEEMDKYYQLTKKDLLEAETIDVLGHSYGPIKALAFLHAIAKDESDGEKILAKVKNLHLYNGLINMEDDENHGVMHTIKLFIFRIRIFIASFLRGEEDPETPDVMKSLINLDKLKSFKPHILFTYHTKDKAAPSSEPFMETVRSNLKAGGVECTVANDSKLFSYSAPSEYSQKKDFMSRFITAFINVSKHQTNTGNVERSEIWKEKIKARAAKSGLTK